MAALIGEVTDGGSRAARGFHLQYLVTLDHLLALVETGDLETSVHVERRDDVDGAVEVIDLSIVESSGHTRLAAQVKSGIAQSRVMSAPEIARTLVALCQSVEADKYEFWTNAKLTEPAETLARALSLGEGGSALEPFAGRALTEEERERCGRARVTSVRASMDVLRQELDGRVRSLRRRVQRGTGDGGSYMLTGFLLSQVMLSAAKLRPSGIDAGAATSWLGMGGDDLAALVGVYDWGLLLGAGWPAPPTIERSDELSDLARRLPAEAGRHATPRVIVNGPSGIGKSALVAAHAYARLDYYRFAVWFTADSGLSLDEALRSLAKRYFPAIAELGHEHLVTAMRDELGRTTDPWLMVLDDITDPAVFGGLIPQQSTGHVIATTRNATLLQDWLPISVAALSREQSMALMATFLLTSEPSGSDRTTVDDNLSQICELLGDWPLGIAMAGSFINAAGADLLSASTDYLEAISARAISEPNSLPEGTSQPLANAIMSSLYAIRARNINADLADPFWPGFMAAVVASYLGVAPLPVSYLLEMVAALRVRMGQEPMQGPIPGTAVDDAVFALRSQSLATTRVAGRGRTTGADTSRTLTFNTVVQAVIRRNMPSGFGSWIIDAVVEWFATFLQWCVRTDHAENALAVAPHVLPFLEHAKLEYHPLLIAQLRGELASCVRQTGDLDQAATLLRGELGILSELSNLDADAHLVRAKTLRQLLEIETTRDQPYELLMQLAEQLAGEAHHLQPSDQPASHRSLQLILQGLQDFLHLGGDRAGYENRIRALTQALNALRTRFGEPDENTIGNREYLRAQAMLSDGDEEGAAALAEQLLSTSPESSLQVQLHMFAAETAVYLREYQRAAQHLRSARSIVETTGAHGRELVTGVSNVFQILGVHAMASESARQLLDEALDAARPHIDQQTSSLDWLRFHDGDARAAMLNADRDRAKRALARQDARSLTQQPFGSPGMILFDDVRRWVNDTDPAGQPDNHPTEAG